MVTTTPVNDAGVLFLLSWGVSGVLLSKLFFDQELLSCVDLRRGSYWSRRALILHGVIFDVDEVCMNTDQNVLRDFWETGARKTFRAEGTIRWSIAIVIAS
jgi:hypothetical protein